MPPGRSPTEPAVTRLLNEAASGSRQAYDALLPVVYEELKVLAAGRLMAEREGHTLNATALVHETYLKLVDQERVEWNSRSHFYAVASQAMRRILIDHARGRRRAKRGGSSGALSLDIDGLGDNLAGQPSLDWDTLIALDVALSHLEQENRRAAEIVEYRFFGGLTYEEIGEVLGVSVPTVRRGWSFARMWLARELADSGT
ncbi:MAG: sigma-70 family RNA polymerase sigma factor [Gemmatimonadetes bacterium]|nr:sigma-70 family RNA polymerase sigma factor [Gemmatimonadota bacterium]